MADIARTKLPTGTTQPADAGKSAIDPTAVARLSGTIRAGVGTLRPDAPAEDYEGSIIFAISQDDASIPVVMGALDEVSVDASPNLIQAIKNVRMALLRRKLNRGTAALDRGFGFGGGGFTSPSSFTPGLPAGGGGSNYTN